MISEKLPELPKDSLVFCKPPEVTSDSLRSSKVDDSP